MPRQAFFSSLIVSRFTAFPIDLLETIALRLRSPLQGPKLAGIVRPAFVLALFALAQTSVACADELIKLNVRGHKNKYELIQEAWLTVKTDRSAQIVVQRNSASVRRICVLEGTVNVRNAIDKSVIKLSAGGVYQSELKDDRLAPLVVASAKADIETQDLIDGDSALPVFETSKCSTVLLKLKDAEKKKLKAEIVSPPSNMNYEIGADVWKIAPLPPHLVHEFPPSGIMQYRTSSQAIAGEQNPQ